MKISGLSAPAPLEVWAGVECTVNRVGEDYLDQLERSGHAHRLSDLDLIAGLGVRAVRYPALWERVAPDGPARADWRWTDERLHRLRDLGLRPIVGFVHHGSGPRHTSLTEPSFVEGLAAYARAFAERYPWVEAYTPVNEPLTTARFSGLYGIWYPHGQDTRTFVRALLTQVQAVAASMQAVRAVNPAARLVQTDDLGHTHSTQALGYQAAFENERRWLGWDLLCGHVGPAHPLWGFLRANGGLEGELMALVEAPCLPDIIGVNHYVTSERYLDENVRRYPAHTRGGNGRHRYADVEAVRVTRPRGPAALLIECAQRYRLPLAITEVHLGCSREEQLRWLRDLHRAALEAREAGADVRALTAWSLFGAYDWDSLLTRDEGHYEPGVFDVRAPSPRPTALAGAVRELASGRPLSNPVLDGPGWWSRPERVLYARPRREASSAAPAVPIVQARPILLYGAGSPLGRTMARLCNSRGLRVETLSLAEVENGTLGSAILASRPWAVINASGYRDAERAEHEPSACFRANVTVAAALAAACAHEHLPLLTFSSALVFDGAKEAPYLEGDAVAPLGVLGRSLASAEACVAATCAEALIVRTGPCFGGGSPDDFLSTGLRTLYDGGLWHASRAQRVSLTYLPDVVDAALDLLVDGEHGLWHLAHADAGTWYDWARRVAVIAGFSPDDVHDLSDPDGVASPSRNEALGSERGWLLPDVEAALSAHVRAVRARCSARTSGDGARRDIASIVAVQ